MSQESNSDLTSLVAAVNALREEVGQLTARVAEIERASAPEITDEVVMVLSAAIAAYLGEKPRIRQIRLARSMSWTHEGRITIQASHALKF